MKDIIMAYPAGAFFALIVVCVTIILSLEQISLAFRRPKR